MAEPKPIVMMWKDWEKFKKAKKHSFHGEGSFTGN